MARGRKVGPAKFSGSPIRFLGAVAGVVGGVANIIGGNRAGRAAREQQKIAQAELNKQKKAFEG